MVGISLFAAALGTISALFQLKQGDAVR